MRALCESFDGPQSHPIAMQSCFACNIYAFLRVFRLQNGASGRPDEPSIFGKAVAIFVLQLVAERAVGLQLANGPFCQCPLVLSPLFGVYLYCSGHFVLTLALVIVELE